MRNHQDHVLRLALLKDLSFSNSPHKPAGAATAVVRDVEIYVPLKGLIDFEEEEKRLGKEITAVEKDLALVAKKLTNQEFLGKAPKDIVEKETQRNQALLEKKEKLQAGLARLKELRTAP